MKGRNQHILESALQKNLQDLTTSKLKKWNLALFMFKVIEQSNYMALSAGLQVYTPKNSDLSINKSGINTFSQDLN